MTTISETTPAELPRETTRDGRFRRQASAFRDRVTADGLFRTAIPEASLYSGCHP